MSKYQHSLNIHSLKDPEKIVPAVIELLNPKSVVDFGCGLGTFLKVFKENGIHDVLGIDGSWTEKSLIYKFLEPEEYKDADLEKRIDLNKRFDLVISVEVIEHLAEGTAEIFIENLIRAGEVILFSAAVPGQGGQNHLNEKWLSYWESHFLKFGYVLRDVLRPIFWNDSDIFWWYKQNMVLFVPQNFEFSNQIDQCNIRDLIHHELFTLRNNELNKVRKRLADINEGKESFKYYLKLLLKSVIKSTNSI